MTLPALDLFALAASEERSQLPLAEVLTYMGPATPDLLRVLNGPPWPCLTLEYSVRPDRRPCPFCNQPIGDQHCVAIMPDGEWRWACPTCALSAKGGKSDIVPNAPWKRKVWPTCVCGHEREQHAYADGLRWCDDDCSIEYKAAA